MKANPGVRVVPHNEATCGTPDIACYKEEEAGSAKEFPSLRKGAKSEAMPQHTFGMAGEISIQPMLSF